MQSDLTETDRTESIQLYRYVNTAIVMTQIKVIETNAFGNETNSTITTVDLI